MFNGCSLLNAVGHAMKNGTMIRNTRMKFILKRTGILWRVPSQLLSVVHTQTFQGMTSLEYSKQKGNTMALSPSEEKFLLKFMETTIKRVNACMARIWALEKLLTEKGVCVSPQDMRKRIEEAEHQPLHIQNAKILEDMVKEFNKKPAKEAL